MKTKFFDFEHELDLERAINDFIKNKEVIKIDYETSHFYDGKEQIFSFSCMIIYNEK